MFLGLAFGMGAGAQRPHCANGWRGGWGPLLRTSPRHSVRRGRLTARLNTASRLVRLYGHGLVCVGGFLRWWLLADNTARGIVEGKMITTKGLGGIRIGVRSVITQWAGPGLGREVDHVGWAGNMGACVV